jgi:signal transduction histidine kinase
MTALDLILALSDFDISKSRRLLRHVITENSSVSFPVTFRSLPDNRYLMHFKPLPEYSLDESSLLLGKRLGAKSILCELVETTSLTRLYELKTRLTDRLGLKLRNDLAAIDLSSSLLGSTDLGHDQRQTISQVIHTKVQSTVQALGECQQYLALNTDIDDLERFPVDPRPPVEAALDEVRPAAEGRGLKIEVTKPHFVSYVFASSEKLEQLFKAILHLMSQDATDNSTILVRLTESEDLVAFDFSNTGFGIPNEVLQEYVFGEQALTSEKLQDIQAGARWVQAWGGILEAVSGVGIGLHFTIHLVKFI